MTSMLDTAFAHHFWANERLLDACAGLTDEQLTTPCPGTYGPIIMTLGHLVSSDGWYLSFFHDSPVRVEEDGSVSVAERHDDRAVGAGTWRRELLVGEPGAGVQQPLVRPEVMGERGVEHRGHRFPPALVATSPMMAASSVGFDHIGQWLVGRSTQVMSWRSAIPPRNAQSGFSFAYFW